MSPKRTACATSSVDRVPGYEPVGRRFESCVARQTKTHPTGWVFCLLCHQVRTSGDAHGTMHFCLGQSAAPLLAAGEIANPCVARQTKAHPTGWVFCLLCHRVRTSGDAHGTMHFCLGQSAAPLLAAGEIANPCVARQTKTHPTEGGPIKQYNNVFGEAA